MMNRFLYLKRMLRTVLLVLLLSIAGMTKAQNENITFADANVKAICVANWDTDGDGELNTTEAAAVTSLDGAFMFDDGITSFNELQFFTGLTSFGEDEFNSCTSLASITIPNAVTSIGNYAFSDCSSLTSMTSYACTPPALGNDVFYNVPSVVVLNVPCHTSAMYQEADGWSDFSNYEEFEYGLCPIPFTDATVKAICVAHWDTNEDGELSYAEAAAVTNLGTYFKSTAITSFDELEYFTSLTSLPNTAFYGCTSLASIAMPASVSALGNGSFYNCTSLATMTVYAETPPTVGTNAFKNVPIEMVVYVPCGTYEVYHTASGWSEFTIVQQSGSCPIIFADANVKALCVANWDTNGDGELSYDEAAAVTDIGMVFKDKNHITSFDELQYFTNLTSISSNAFYRCRALTSIVIPNSVTSIGSSVFELCSSLTSIEIPNSVISIGWYTFYHCSGLTSIEIPNSVTSIGYFAFSFCSSLEQIVVDSGNMFYDSRENRNAIIRTSTNELVTGCKNTIIPNSVTSIGTSAFMGCSGLTSIEIPNSVTSIGSYAFMYCSSLTSIEIPNSVTSIGDYTFSACSGLEQIIVDSGNTFYDSRENCNAVIKTSTNELISGCKNTIIPNSVTSIGNYTFFGCSNLIFIEIPNSVISIGDRAFENCSGLTSIIISNSMNSIGSYAFLSCSGLTSMTVLAYNPPILDNYAFSNVDKTIPVYVPIGTVSAYRASSGWNEFTNIQEIGPNPITFADANVKALCVANWDADGDGELSYDEAAAVTDLGEVFKDNSIITSFDELQYFTSLNSIGNYAFWYCNNLTSIVIPNSVTYIGDYAFRLCSNLTFVNIGNSVTSIGDFAFGHCSSLTSIDIPNSVTSIGHQTFAVCSGLTSIEIPNSVVSIGTYAFSGCTGLTSITIPNSVTLIETNPFSGCISLQQITVESGNLVYDSRNNCNAVIKTSTNELVVGCENTVIPNSVTSVCTHAFDECTGLTSITIPNSVISIENDAFISCSNLSFISIPSSVIFIGFAFRYCNGIEQIVVDSGNTVYDSRGNCNAIINTGTNELITGCKNTFIPNTVTSIGRYAFEGCRGLTSITIPNSVISIGESAFGDCRGLTSIEIPNSVVTIEGYAFYYCSSLNTIVIPNFVTFIGSYAFRGCWNLTSLTVLPNNPPVLGTNSFSDINKQIPVYVPCGALYAYQNANGWNEFTNYMPGTDCDSGEITVMINPAESGTVTGIGYYEGGVTCTLTAMANSGYYFQNWTENGEVVSSNTEYSFTVSGDRVLVANFNLIPPAPVIAEYYPNPNEPNNPYVKVHWATSSFEVQIGEGTLTFGYFPFYTYYNYSIAENLFLASELVAAGVTSSPMTSLSWYATNAPGFEQQGISIWMANVSDTELTTTSHTVNDMTLVYTGSITPEIGWNEFVFNEGTFVWDGVSNVLIFCQRNNGVWNNSVWWQSQNVGFNASSYNYTDYYPYNANETNTMYISTTRPNIIMKGEGGISYNLYRANCDGTNTQLIAENLNESQFIDETWWQLENDSYKYGVSIADSTNTDIFWSNCIEKQGNVAVQTVTLFEGTNWFSTYLDITLDDLKAALVDALGTNASITIKSKNQNVKYQHGRWTGQLASLDLAKMYLIDVSSECEITLEGMPIDPTTLTLTISEGANYIAFPYSQSMPVANLFGTFPANLDQVKSKVQNTKYNRGRWTGSLTSLEPGKGYIYISAEATDRVFTFPTNSK